MSLKIKIGNIDSNINKSWSKLRFSSSLIPSNPNLSRDITINNAQISDDKSFFTGTVDFDKNSTFFTSNTPTNITGTLIPQESHFQSMNIESNSKYTTYTFKKSDIIPLSFNMIINLKGNNSKYYLSKNIIADLPSSQSNTFDNDSLTIKFVDDFEDVLASKNIYVYNKKKYYAIPLSVSIFNSSIKLNQIHVEWYANNEKIFDSTPTTLNTYATKVVKLKQSTKPGATKISDIYYYLYNGTLFVGNADETNSDVISSIKYKCKYWYGDDITQAKSVYIYSNRDYINVPDWFPISDAVPSLSTTNKKEI